ncbi:hypothetical protein K440DRAFT_657783 [Wilcoxina mikolae CBS 423.85]|nr:hypothetical protein K440DRAFT_657783 [Wilcoxina mikolae CBS 423.85]
MFAFIVSVAFPGASFALPLQKYSWRPTLGNDTALFSIPAPSWVPEPQYRGTWGIIYSCTLTLILTVYKSLHLNVPAHLDSYRYYLRGIKWAAIALVAPEFVLNYAFVQWHEAIRLCADLYDEEQKQRLSERELTEDGSARQACTSKEVSGSVQHDTKPPPSDDHTHRPLLDAHSRKDNEGGCFLDPEVWIDLLTAPFNYHKSPFHGLKSSLNRPRSKNFPLKYGFYVGMGGFVMDTTKHDRECARMTVTTSGVLALARQGHFLKIDPATISDKSKADTLAKTCARKANGLPISLLEIHTLVHVFCALVMYCFWLKKPVGVRDPTIIEEEDGDLVWEKFQRRESGLEDLAKKQKDSAIIEESKGSDKFQRRESDLDDLPNPKPVRRTSRYNNELAPRAYGTPHIEYDFGQCEYLIIRVLMFVIAAMYGGVHLVAWSFDLPTKIESYIWRVSCIISMVSSFAMPLWSLMGYFVFYRNLDVWKAVVKLHETIWVPFRRPRDGVPGAGTLVVCVVLYAYFIFSLLLLPLCIGARVAIIMESFFCLRKVPQGVYVKVLWTEYIPHM